MNDITILPSVACFGAYSFGRFKEGKRGRVYYHGGNIYQPLTIDGSEVSRVRRAIKEFLRDNADMVLRDRAAPDYRTLTQLAAEQIG